MLLDKFRQAKLAETAQLNELAKQKKLPVPFIGERQDFLQALLSPLPAPQTHRVRVIAEFKQASPSQGIICQGLSPTQVAEQYSHAGATCVSVLTEETYFGGKLEYLDQMNNVGIPLLRKDFIFDPLQVIATAATPAAALLLIVRLTPQADILRALREQAESYGIHAVVEIFDEADLQLARASGARIIQVNARDLDTLLINSDACYSLVTHKQAGECWIAASGICTAQNLLQAEQTGFDAVLIGTHLMQQGTPGTTLHQLIKQYHRL